jgi:hypothetical protein
MHTPEPKKAADRIYRQFRWERIKPNNSPRHKINPGLDIYTLKIEENSNRYQP